MSSQASGSYAPEYHLKVSELSDGKSRGSAQVPGPRAGTFFGHTN